WRAVKVLGLPIPLIGFAGAPLFRFFHLQARHAAAMFVHVTFVHSYLPSVSLYVASNSCRRRLNAAGSLERFSSDNVRITSDGMPLGLSDFNFGRGCGAVRLRIDAAVFCRAVGFEGTSLVGGAETGAEHCRGGARIGSRGGAETCAGARFACCGVGLL